MNQDAKDTPILDLLAKVPLNGRAIHHYGPNKTHSSSIPYGNLCKMAADRIVELERQLEDLSKPKP